MIKLYSRSFRLSLIILLSSGMQHYVIVNDQPWGLPLNETTMALIFKEHGYQTNLLGKWHLGMSQRNYTPTARGFDHHLGYLGAYVDYYDQTYEQPVSNLAVIPYKFQINSIMSPTGQILRTWA